MSVDRLVPYSNKKAILTFNDNFNFTHSNKGLLMRTNNIVCSSIEEFNKYEDNASILNYIEAFHQPSSCKRLKSVERSDIVNYLREENKILKEKLKFYENQERVEISTIIEDYPKEHLLGKKNYIILMKERILKKLKKKKQ